MNGVRDAPFNSATVCLEKLKIVDSVVFEKVLFLFQVVQQLSQLIRWLLFTREIAPSQCCNFALFSTNVIDILDRNY